MKFYGVSDILDLGGKKEIFPVVDIVLDKGKVSFIVSLETGMGIFLDDNFEISNCFEKENKKALKQVLLFVYSNSICFGICEYINIWRIICK